MTAPSDPIHPSDLLRTSENVLAPDVRNEPNFERVPGSVVPPELDQRLKDLTQFNLTDRVPSRVRIHFETAKNLYAYSWFVYRFHMVAQQHALATLELALRIRFFPPDGLTAGKRTTLFPLLKRAMSEGLLLAPEFRVVQRIAKQRARERVSFEATRKMMDLGLDSIEVSDGEITPLVEDYPVDWLESWIVGVPKLRNTHAHGTWSLWPTVLGTFEQVTDAVNQLWKYDSGAPASGLKDEPRAAR